MKKEKKEEERDKKKLQLAKSEMYYRKGVHFMNMDMRHKERCEYCKEKSQTNNCKVSREHNSQAILCFYRSVMNIPFHPVFYKFYRDVIQNIGKCYWNLNLYNKSLLCYHRVVQIDNKLNEPAPSKN